MRASIGVIVLLIGFSPDAHAQIRANQNMPPSSGISLSRQSNEVNPLDRHRLQRMQSEMLHKKLVAISNQIVVLSHEVQRDMERSGVYSDEDLKKLALIEKMAHNLGKAMR